MNFYYLPRSLDNVDPLYKENAGGTYSRAYLIDMYVKNPLSGFNGKGDFQSFLGAEIRDSFTLVVARRTWIAEVGDPEKQPRPNEGDLVYFPLNRKLFKITFVEHESIFYQVGALQVWELKASLLEYSGEKFETGIPEIDALGGRYDTDVSDEGLMLEDGGAILDELNGLPLLPEDFTFSGEDELGSQNDYFQEQGDSFIDFTCIDPFVAPDGTY